MVGKFVGFWIAVQNFRKFAQLQALENATQRHVL